MHNIPEAAKILADQVTSVPMAWVSSPPNDDVDSSPPAMRRIDPACVWLGSPARPPANQTQIVPTNRSVPQRCRQTT